MVPLYILPPSGRGKGDTQKAVSQLQIAPALLKLLGLPIPKMMEAPPLDWLRAASGHRWWPRCKRGGAHRSTLTFAGRADPGAGAVLAGSGIGLPAGREGPDGAWRRVLEKRSRLAKQDRTAGKLPFGKEAATATEGPFARLTRRACLSDH